MPSAVPACPIFRGKLLIRVAECLRYILFVPKKCSMDFPIKTEYSISDISLGCAMEFHSVISYLDGIKGAVVVMTGLIANWNKVDWYKP